MIRGEAIAFLLRWREVIFSAALAAFGGWLVALGGFFLLPLGVATIALAGLLALTGWRKLRFRQEVAAPGIVEVLEGQVSYHGPETGGFISLRELQDIRLLTLRGRRMWRMKQTDGQALLVPVDATGAEALFDAFTSLPGMDMAGLLQALDPQGDGTTTRGLVPAGTPEMRLIWARKGAGLVA